MSRVSFLLSILALAQAAAASTVPFGTASADGLSGYAGLPSADVLEQGIFRLQGSFEYMKPDGDGHVLRVPLQAGYGWFEDIEIAAGIPLYVSDDVWNESILGNLTVSGAWKYETARGGSALRLSGGVTIPTGSEGRDTDEEMFIGASTSTTFRLFRLSAGASYTLGSKSDRMGFSFGGASFITGDLLVHGALSGSTAGEFGLTAGLTAAPWERLAVTASGTLGLDGPWDFVLSAGLTWTGLSF